MRKELQIAACPAQWIQVLCTDSQIINGCSMPRQKGQSLTFRMRLGRDISIQELGKLAQLHSLLSFWIYFCAWLCPVLWTHHFHQCYIYSSPRSSVFVPSMQLYSKQKQVCLSLLILLVERQEQQFTKAPSQCLEWHTLAYYNFPKPSFLHLQLLLKPKASNILD